MTDLAPTIVPKSDQLNADDLITGPMTITITAVSKVKGDQPVFIRFEGDDGKPYKPCLSMRRVLVMVWGRNAAAYAGRRLRLYRDPAVQFGGAQIGGIRISHMSHIDEPKTMVLTVTRTSRKPFTVRPLDADTLPRDVPAGRAPDGAAANAAPSSSSIRFGGADFEPDKPRPIAPISVAEMEPSEARGFATALADLIKAAPFDLKARWLQVNAADLEALKQRNAAWAERLQALATESAALRESAAADDATEADGRAPGSVASSNSTGADL